MKSNPLVPFFCRVKRFVRSCKPEVRVRAEGEVGVYADKTAAKPAVCFKLNQDYAVPLLKALAVVIGMVALFKLFDD